MCLSSSKVLQFPCPLWLVQEYETGFWRKKFFLTLKVFATLPLSLQFSSTITSLGVLQSCGCQGCTGDCYDLWVFQGPFLHLSVCHEASQSFPTSILKAGGVCGVLIPSHPMACESNAHTKGPYHLHVDKLLVNPFTHKNSHCHHSS